jgi:pyrroline-5-carboxylate reductase
MIIEDLFGLTGDCVWVDEVHVDLLATLSGSGPAYIFKFCELMAEAAAAQGLPKQMAIRLIRQTLLGSGALLANSDSSLAELREKVTSPGGMTAAGLEQLEKGEVLSQLVQLFEASLSCAKKLRETEVGDL